MIRAETPQDTVHYRYDALGGRIAKYTAQGETRFQYDGPRLLAETDSQRSRTYLFEPGCFRPLALHEQDNTQASGSTYRYHLDHLGTPRELTDSQGHIVWSASYRAYGNLALADIEEIDNPLRFQGQYYDAETGLHYNLNRYYDPNAGRFIHQDPIGLEGGVNGYQYAPNPVNWIDPLGLTGKDCGTASPQFVYDAKSGRYRNAVTGRFTSAKDLPWPGNRGFTSSAPGNLESGTIIDRFGSSSGRYAGQPGATVAERGMAQGADAMPYTQYEVIKTLPAEIGPAAPVPAFGAEGGATQYLFNSSIDDLVKQGYLKKL